MRTPCSLLTFNYRLSTSSPRKLSPSTKMKTYILAKDSSTLDGLKQTHLPEPQPTANQVLIRVRATSLNFRDNLVANGAGEVISVGPNVKRFKQGDKVAGTFFQTWFDGAMQYSRPTMGGSTNGMLSHLSARKKEGVVPPPDASSFEEGAPLPCAAVTAWHALHATRNR